MKLTTRQQQTLSALNTTTIADGQIIADRTHLGTPAGATRVLAALARLGLAERYVDYPIYAITHEGRTVAASLPQGAT